MSLREWLRCPVCESPNVSYHDMARPVEGYTWLEVSCTDCPESHSVHVNWTGEQPRVDSVNDTECGPGGQDGDG